MCGLKVRIRCVTDAAEPVSVECVMTDLEGQTHAFRNHLSVFTMESEPMIPGDGVIRCSLLEETPMYAVIDTALPDNVESTMGQTRFKVSPHDLIDNA